MKNFSFLKDLEYYEITLIESQEELDEMLHDGEFGDFEEPFVVFTRTQPSVGEGHLLLRELDMKQLHSLKEFAFDCIHAIVAAKAERIVRDDARNKEGGQHG